mgnify:FL=1
MDMEKYIELISYRKNHNEVERKRVVDEAIKERKERRMVKATKESWKTLPMTENIKELQIDINLVTEELDLIKLGHVPFEMEDHWFMFYDDNDNTINYYRSWTGHPVFKGYVNVDDNKVYKLIISLEKEVYTERNTDEEVINQFKKMIENEIKYHK